MTVVVRVTLRNLHGALPLPVKFVLDGKDLMRRLRLQRQRRLEEGRRIGLDLTLGPNLRRLEASETHEIVRCAVKIRRDPAGKLPLVIQRLVRQADLLRIKVRAGRFPGLDLVSTTRRRGACRLLLCRSLRELT